jgi:hypothetical protein
MSFNVIEELQEVDSKSPATIKQSVNVMNITTAKARILFFGIPLLPIQTKLSVCLV